MSFMVIRLLQAFDSFALDEDAQPPETKPLPEWRNEVGTRKGMEKFFPKVGLTLYAHVSNSLPPLYIVIDHWL